MAILNSVLVIAPAGKVGQAICKELGKRKDRFKRIAAFNNTSRGGSDAKDNLLADLHNLGLETVSGSYQDVDIFRGFDVVIMPLGNHGLYLQPQIIDTAIAAGVRHFYPSEFGADLLVGDNWHQRYYKYKTITREHLTARSKDTEGLGWTFVEIGRFTECSLAYFMHTLSDPFDESIPTSRQRTYRFNGGPYTWSQIFSTLEKITGHPYDVTYVPVEQVLEKEARAKEIGDVDLELEASHQLIQGREGTLLPQPWDNGRFPNVKPKGLEEALKQAFGNPGMREFLGL
ncbi:NAD(P)-binding protein [Glonium stellatum]|uniref:NAD(P)-binding protein n=1 Tax=Glonium stellatum TaxID=574774 RepID=A0A8E2FDN3_9PEZI|nr:NAD(P)-binding protein [Glonium stellatum]